MNLALPISHYPSISYEGYQLASDVGEKLNRKWAQEKNYLKGSASDWLPTVDAALRSLRAECQQVGWDGPGSLAISDQAIAIAEKVVTALFRLVPKNVPAPDVIPEADGEICLRWVVDTEQEFSISIGSHGKINFAGQFGREGGIHGWQPLDTASPTALDRSLQEISKYVARLFPPIVGRRSA
ncbi:MAG TPA: hypothetical protein VMZ30_10670 [Pyrinomonadaceae bacterium]|nr:hypothetical protein [Pyrinomonadaceae bacterium]